MTGDAHLILVAGALLAVGAATALVATRLRVPALVLFLGIGMAIGSDGLGWIYLDDYALARLIGTVALLVILFEGGLQTGLATLRPVLGSAVSLATAGTALTAVISGLAAHWLLLGDAQLAQRSAVHAFHEGLATVAEMGMFLTLGLLVFPSRLGGVLVLALLARPLAAYAATLGSRLGLRERALVGWAGADQAGGRGSGVRHHEGR